MENENLDRSSLPDNEFVGQIINQFVRLWRLRLNRKSRSATENVAVHVNDFHDLPRLIFLILQILEGMHADLAWFSAVGGTHGLGLQE